MKAFLQSKLLALALSIGICACPFQATADDIDIYVGTSAGTAANPNVLLVLDNTSNWTATLDGSTQGETEINAIKTIVALLDDTINVGLMMFTDNPSGPGGRRGAYISFPVVPMTPTNKALFTAKLDFLLANFGTPTLKSPSNPNYGEPLFEAFKYFGGFTNPAHVADDVGAGGGPPPSTYTYGDATKAAGTITFTHADGTTSTVVNTPADAQHFGPNVYTTATDWSLADDGGYASTVTTPPVFKSPISEDNNCGKNYVIFIGNAYPDRDNQNPNNFTMLSGLGGNATSIPTSPSTADRSGDEWTRFLFQTDVSPAKGTQNVTTFAIDVFNLSRATQPRTLNQTALLQSMARVGGGKYYPATDAAAVLEALKRALDEILAVNSVFASVSLPANTTNRAINENQIFIAMFRPDPAAQPRWFGNAKEYKLIRVGGSVDLGDANGQQAINPTTGFMTSCATSRFTTDSGTYWQGTTYNPRPAGSCPATAYDEYSDSPDGPFVEKGGIAEVIRRGNSAATNVTPTWVLNRTLYTQVGSSLVAPTTANTGLSQALLDFVSGKDRADGTNATDENGNGTAIANETRPSLHGDVIHSRPLAINYGGATGTVLYYGANDGTFRAVEVTKTTGSGRELWALLAPEFFSTRTHSEATPSTIHPLQRLMDNLPHVLYPQMPTPPASAARRDYFFDGSTGSHQDFSGSTPSVWIYPTFRRGGRMIYALDVSAPATPVFMWKRGCDETGACTPDSSMSGIGQTWSLPKIMRASGYSTTARLVIAGGGYDTCEDADTASPSCGSTKGNHVYVFNASNGTIEKVFDTDRSVAADVSIIDVDGDQMIDHAFVADTGGNLYRIDFVDPATKAARTSSAWTITKVAYTAGGGRKFLFGPALYATQGKIYAALGSGDREHPLQGQYPYLGTGVTNRFYVYLDDATVTPGTPTNLDDATVLANYSSISTCDTEQILATSDKKGWFMDLNAYGTGEQTVTSALIANSLIVFSTNRPTPASVGTCATSLGEARGYWVNLFNASGAISTTDLCGGDRSGIFTGGGLVASPARFNVPINPGEAPFDGLMGVADRGGPGPSSPFTPREVPTGGYSSTRKIIYWNTSTDN